MGMTQNEESDLSRETTAEIMGPFNKAKKYDQNLADKKTDKCLDKNIETFDDALARRDFSYVLPEKKYQNKKDICQTEKLFELKNGSMILVSRITSMVIELSWKDNKLGGETGQEFQVQVRADTTGGGYFPLIGFKGKSEAQEYIRHLNNLRNQKIDLRL